MEQIYYFLNNFSDAFSKSDYLLIDIFIEKIIQLIFEDTVNGKIEKYFNENLFKETNDNLKNLIDPFNILMKFIEDKNKGSLNDFKNCIRSTHSNIIEIFNELNMNEFYKDFINSLDNTIQNKKQNLRNTKKENECNKLSDDKIKFDNIIIDYENKYKFIEQNNNENFHKNIKLLLEYKKFLEKYDVFNEENGIKVGIGEFQNLPQKNIEIKIIENNIINKINSNELDDNKIYFNLHLYANTPNIYINNTIQSINFNNINISEISNEKVEIIKEKMVKYQEKQEIPESEIIINTPTLIFKNSNQVQSNFIFNCENSNENENFKKIDGLLGDLNLFLEKLDEKESKLLKYSEENISKLIKKTRDTFNYDYAKFENNPDEDPKEINCLLEKFKKFKIRTEQSLKLYKANYVKYQESEISYPKEKNKFIIPNLSNIQII